MNEYGLYTTDDILTLNMNRLGSMLNQSNTDSILELEEMISDAYGRYTILRIDCMQYEWSNVEIDRFKTILKRLKSRAYFKNSYKKKYGILDNVILGYAWSLECGQFSGKWHMHMVFFIKQSHVSIETIYTKLCNVLRYLSDKDNPFIYIYERPEYDCTIHKLQVNRLAISLRNIVRYTLSYLTKEDDYMKKIKHYLPPHTRLFGRSMLK